MIQTTSPPLILMICRPLCLIPVEGGGITLCEITWDDEATTADKNHMHAWFLVICNNVGRGPGSLFRARPGPGV